MLKATPSIEHGGGQKIVPDSQEYRTLLAWIEQGTRFDDPSLPKLQSVTLGPAEVTLAKRAEQSISAMAVYADGSQRDVTPLAIFRSSDPSVAKLDAAGKLTVVDFGMCTIVGQYARECGVQRIVVPQPLDEPFPGYKPVNKIDQLVLANLDKLGWHVAVRDLRRLLATPGELVDQLTRLAQTVQLHDEQIAGIIQVLRQMMEKPPDKPKRKIGFHATGEPEERRKNRCQICSYRRQTVVFDAHYQGQGPARLPRPGHRPG